MIGYTARNPVRLDDAFASVQRAVDQHRVPSAVMAVALPGLERVEAFSRPRGDLVTPGTVFFLASVTKPIVATAVMQLVERGLLDLHGPIARHVPEFDGPGRERIAPWHILTHTSGIPDYPPDAMARERPTARRMLELTYRSPLRFEPGTRWEYCSSSFYLLGEAVRRVTGLTYPEYLRRNVLGPAGMTTTTFDPRRLRSPVALVHGIGVENRIKRWFMLRYVSAISAPGGGLFASAGDLLRFGQALLPDEADGSRAPMLLARETVESMSADHTRGIVGDFDGVEQPVHHALGWMKNRLMRPGPLPGSTSSFDHGGATGTRLWIDPDHRLVFVFLTNQWSADDSTMWEGLVRVYEALGVRAEQDDQRERAAV